MRMVPLLEVVGQTGLMIDGDWVESKDQDPAGSVRLIQLADVGIGRFLDKSARYMSREAARRLNCTFLIPNDILVARMPDPIGRACIFPGSGQPCVTVVDVCIVRPDASVADFRYLKWAINSDFFLRNVETFVKGSTRQRISRKSLEGIPIPLPPLSEQAQIAAILDQADEVRRKRRIVSETLDRLPGSIFAAKFGDLRTNSREWPVVPVSHYVSEFQGGKSLESDKGNTSARYWVLKVSAVTSGLFKPEECKPLPRDYEPAREHFVRDGDLLFSRANTTALVGAVAYVDEAPDGLVLPDKLWRFVWKKPEVVVPLFVRSLFQSSFTREEIGRRATGTSGSMKNVSQAKLLSMPTILPPLELQEDFSKQVCEVRALQDKNNLATAKVNALFDSLQHRAFRGELTAKQAERELAEVG